MANEKGEKIGLVKAVELTRAESVIERAAEQLSLLPSAAAAKMAGDQSADGEVAQRRGPGRPPGSRNKRTEEWCDFILGRYRSPMLFLAEAYSRPVEVLAAELGCDKLDAFKAQTAAALALAPFLHQKQPVAVEITDTGVVQLILEVPAEVDLGGGDGLVIDVEEPGEESEENQPLSGDDKGEVSQ